MSERLFACIDEYIAALPEAQASHEERIWKEFGVTAVVFILDMEGFTVTVRRSGLMSFLGRVRRMQKAVTQVIERHLGQVVKCEADNLYGLFERPDNAIRAALDLTYETPPEVRDQIGGLGIGLCQGRLLFVPRQDFFGDPVNIASALAEDLSRPGEILIDESMRPDAEQVPGLEIEECQFAKGGSQIRYYKVRRAAAGAEVGRPPAGHPWIR